MELRTSKNESQVQSHAFFLEREYEYYLIKIENSRTMTGENSEGKYVKLVSAEGQEFFLDKDIAMVRYPIQYSVSVDDQELLRREISQFT